MIILDKNYCRRCKKYHISTKKQNYCLSCARKIAIGQYNRWKDSQEFISTSFEDCYDKSHWSGFNKKKKYKKAIIKQILQKFPELSYLKSGTKAIDFENIKSDTCLYIVSDQNKEILKVGQSVNIKSRFTKYYNISKYPPFIFDVFCAETYEKQDLYEEKIRNYLEYLGYILPLDNTNGRLKYIKDFL